MVLESLPAHTYTIVQWIEDYIAPCTDIAILGAAYFEFLSPRAQDIVKDEVELRSAEVKYEGLSWERLRMPEPANQWEFVKREVPIHPFRGMTV